MIKQIVLKCRVVELSSVEFQITNYRLSLPGFFYEMGMGRDGHCCDVWQKFANNLTLS